MDHDIHILISRGIRQDSGRKKQDINIKEKKHLLTPKGWNFILTSNRVKSFRSETKGERETLLS